MRTFGKNVKVNSDAGSLSQNNPATARDSIGNIWIVWDQTTSAGDTDIYIGKLPANGTAFAASVPVVTNPNDQLYPSIAIDSGNKLYVAWQDNRQAGDNNQGEWDIYLSTSTNGTTWSTAKRINDPDENNQINPSIVINPSTNKAYLLIIIPFGF